MVDVTPTLTSKTVLVSKTVLSGLLAAGSLISIAMYLVVAVVRIRYPFELQWMEGGSVDHVRRVLHGQSIYQAPSVDFVSFAYPPL